MPDEERGPRGQSCYGVQRGIGDIPRVVTRQTAPVSLIVVHSTIGDDENAVSAPSRGGVGPAGHSRFS